jgi:DNA-binding response OmpR family regulator
MPGPPPLILLVEGEPEISMVISDILDDAGFRTEVAGNYTDWIVLLNASHPALLIANVLLPGGGDGHKLAEVARRIGVPTLLVSGHPEVTVEAEAYASPLLAKPFGLSELRRAIRTLIGGEPAARDRPRSGGTRLTVTDASLRS